MNKNKNCKIHTSFYIIESSHLQRPLVFKFAIKKCSYKFNQSEMTIGPKFIIFIMHIINEI